MWAISGCGDVYVQFTKPKGYSCPCDIQDVLLEASEFPDNSWIETGSRSISGAPLRMGIDRVGTSYSTVNDGALNEAYQFKNDNQAKKAFNNSSKTWFISSEYRTDWMIPPELDKLAVNADRFQVGCNHLVDDGNEHCQYVAQYGSFVVYLLAGMNSLSYEEFNIIVSIVDQRAINCLDNDYPK